MDLTRASSIEDKKYIDILDVYNDKSFVYSVLCNQSARFYNVLQYSFQIPIILTSSVLSVLNGSQNEDLDKHLKLINTIFNIITALVLSLKSTFQFESKYNDFKLNGMKFQKLSHLIESKVLEGNINQDFVNMVMTAYDNIVESLDADVPSHICNRVRKEYATKKHLPICINGIKKENNHSIPCSPYRKLSTILLNNIVLNKVGKKMIAQQQSKQVRFNPIGTIYSYSNNNYLKKNPLHFCLVLLKYTIDFYLYHIGHLVHLEYF